MNDDMLLLISYISIDKSLVKIATTINGGLNRDEFQDLKYYAEPKILQQWKDILPLHVANHIDFIVVPMYQKFVHVLHSVQGSLLRQKVPIDTRIDIYQEGDELLAKLKVINLKQS